MKRRRFVASVLSATASVYATGCVGSTETDGASQYPERLPRSATAGFDHHDLDVIRAHDSLDVLDYAAPRLFDRLPGVALENVEEATAFGRRRGTAVATGVFDVEDASEALESGGFVEAGERYGHRLFEDRSGDGGVAVALNATACVRSSVGVETVRDTVDILEDDAPTAADTNDDLGLLVDELGNGAFVTGVVDGGGAVAARGKSVEVEAGEPTARVTLVRVFRTAAEAANRTATLNETAAERIHRPVAETDGRTIRVVGEVNVSRL